MKPQVVALLAELRARGDEGITSLEAMRAGCGSRLAARVAELRSEGYLVTSELVRTDAGARVARYRIHEPVQPVQMALAM